MQSLPGYFEHIKDKTYIDKYPRKIIDLDELKKGKLLEFGPGTGNDLIWLLQHGMSPDRMLSFEDDIEAYKILSDKLYRRLEKMFQDGMPLDRLFSMKNEEVASQIRSYTAQELALFWVFLHVPIDIQDLSYPATESFDYVYANNCYIV